MMVIFLIKQLSSYSGWLKTSLVSFLLIFIGCNSIDERYLILKSHLYDMHNYLLEDEIKSVIIVDETGQCKTCINNFSAFILTQINNPKILFLISSPGIRLDISEYLNFKENKNIIFDRHNKFSDTRLIGGSGVIFLFNQSIDTIIEINSKTLEEDINYISQKISGWEDL